MRIRVCHTLQVTRTVVRCPYLNKNFCKSWCEVLITILSYSAQQLNYFTKILFKLIHQQWRTLEGEALSNSIHVTALRRTNRLALLLSQCGLTLLLSMLKYIGRRLTDNSINKKKQKKNIAIQQTWNKSAWTDLGCSLICGLHYVECFFAAEIHRLKKHSFSAWVYNPKW